MIRYLLDPVLKDNHPYILFIFPALFIASGVDWKSGVAVLVLGMLIANLLFAAPRMSFLVESPANQVGLLIYLAVGGAGVYLADAHRSTNARMQVALAVAAAEARLAAIVESSEDAIISKSIDGIIRTWNAGAEKLFGYSATEAIGQSIKLILLPEQHESERLILERLRRGETIEHFDTVRVAKGGRHLDVALTISPIRDADGRVIGASKVARDMTARRRVETALRVSEERLRLALRGASGGAWNWNLQSGDIWWSPELYELWGIVPNTAMTVASSLAAVYVDDHELIRRTAAEAVANGTIYHCEFRIHHPTRGERWMASHGQVTRDESGNPTYLLGISFDVTDRRTAELALRERERFLGIVTSSARVGMVVVDGRYEYLFANEAYAEIFGLDPQHVVGRRVYELLPKGWAQIQPRLDRALAGEHISYELAIPSKSDAADLRWFRVMYEPRKDEGKPPTIVVVVMEITELKRSESDARKSGELLRAVADGTTDAVFVKDRDGKYLLLNEAAARFVGRSILEVLGQDDAALFDPEGADIVMNRDRRVMASGKVETEEETLTAVGITRTYLATKAPYWGENGNIIGVIGISRDITERKRIEEDLKQSQSLLSVASRIGRMGAWSVELPSLEVTWSDELRAIYGLPLDRNLSVEEGLGFYVPEYRQTIWEAFQACAKSGIPFDVEVQTDVQNGDRIWVRVIGEAVREDSGTIVGIHGAFQNISDRKWAQQRLTTQHAVITILAQATDLLEAAPKLLQAICENTGWDLGDLWTIDKSSNALVYVDQWHDEQVAAVEFREASRQTMFTSGMGLPGRVWANRKSLWIADVTQDTNFTRAKAAAIAGLHGAFGFPIQFENEVLGVGEFFSRDSRQPDSELCQMFDSLGSQIGQFVERKRAESGLRLFRALIDHATDGIEVVDPQTGRFLDANHKSCVTHGYSREEYLCLGMPDVDPSVASVTWNKMARDGKLSGFQSMETRHKRKDGSTFPVEINFNTIRLDREYIIAVVRDISDRKQAEETLQLRGRAMQAVTQGILITSANLPDNPITYASPGFERITGYTAEEVLGRNCRFLQGKDTDPLAVDKIRDAIQAIQPCTVELLNYRKDRTPFWNELSIAPVLDDVGRLAHFVAVQSDVTARKSLESQFRQAQKMEAIGQLAGGVAHDFNNLLTVINGYSELLLSEMLESDPAFHPIKTILEAGERAAGLTSQLLAFSRRSVLKPRVLDPNSLVTETGKILTRLIGEDIRLSIALDPRVGRVKVDPGQFGQVLMNLAVNARDAMPTGGRLTIETSAVHLDEASVLRRPEVRPGRYVIIAVSDTGLGMTDEVKARVFEPFFTTKGEGKGTGLGLATVFGIVKQSSGHLEVYSEIGVGTTFKLYLPAIEEIDDLAASKEPVIVRGGAETILLVEDQAEVRKLAFIALQTYGYVVIEATDGEDAVRIVERDRPNLDILVTDVVMPGMSGRQLAESLCPQYPGMKVLYTSGYTDDAVVRHGILQADVAFLHKPYTPFALARKVREVLDQ